MPQTPLPWLTPATPKTCRPFYSSQRSSILVSRLNLVSSYFKEYQENIAALEDLPHNKRDRRLHLFYTGTMGGTTM